MADFSPTKNYVMPHLTRLHNLKLERNQEMALKPGVLAFGALTHLPMVTWLHRKLWISPDPAPPDKCYGLWLKHLCMATQHANMPFPKRVGELGPGLSAGVGLSALIGGVDTWHGFDVLPFINRRKMPADFESLLNFYLQRARPSNAAGFPNFEHLLNAGGFPATVIPEEKLQVSMAEDRLSDLRAQVHAFANHAPADQHPSLRYLAPWQDNEVEVVEGSLDMVFSHGVLQHIDAIESAVKTIRSWLRPGGVTTHQIDFSCLGTSKSWNGHWACPDWQWKMALGRKDFLINRLPASKYIEIFESQGFEVKTLMRYVDRGGYSKLEFTGPWRDMSDEDAVSRGGLLVAVAR